MIEMKQQIYQQSMERCSSWWFDKSTQEARENFCLKYSKIIANKDNQIIDIINNLK